MTLPKYEQDKLYEVRPLCGSNVSKAQRLLKDMGIIVTCPTIKRYYSQKGLEVSSERGGKRHGLESGKGAMTDEEKENIIKIYHDTGKDYKKTVELSGRSVVSVRKVLADENLIIIVSRKRAELNGKSLEERIR